MTLNEVFDGLRKIHDNEALDTTLRQFASDAINVLNVEFERKAEDDARVERVGLQLLSMISGARPCDCITAAKTLDKMGLLTK